jgi:serine protease
MSVKLLPRCGRFVALAVLSAALSGVVNGGGLNAPQSPFRQKFNSAPLNDRLIVKLRASARPTISVQAVPGASLSQAALAAASIASTTTGRSVTALRDMSGDAAVLRVASRVSADELAQLAAQIAADPRVEYAIPDARRYRLLAPNDPQYSGNQSHYQARSGSNVWGINAPTAWDATTGNSSVRIAVLDSGIVSHADLNANVLAGYDMVSDVNIGNDGDGRDTDAADPGDWITSGESASGFFQGCPVENSSWHGSHVAGTIAAVTNNAVGAAGINWSARIVPVRVLGKCGGFTSDIVDGIRWAAGLSVPAAPANANPVRVINMSLGGPGTCSTVEQDAIDAVVAAGVVVVVAAGNSNADLTQYSPASCNNVLAVSSITSNGARSNFSNFGASAFIAAPGSSVRSTLNTGTTTPVASPAGDTYDDYNGTSMASPHVAGVVGLMLAINPALTVAEIRTKLAAAAEPFVIPASGLRCYGNTCGAGMLDAARAVALAADNTPRVAWVTKSARAAEGTTVALIVERSGTASAAASVAFATTAGSAGDGTDFTVTSGTINWAAGESGKKTISVAIAPDAAIEADETFTVTLSSPSGVTIYGAATATVDIRDTTACAPTPLPVSYTAAATAFGAIASTDCPESPDGASGYFQDYYALPLSAGDRVSVDLSGYKLNDASGILDTFVFLIGPAEQIIVTSDDDGPRSWSMIDRFPIVSSGTYKIVVGTFSPADFGNYGITVRRSAACNLDMNADNQVTASVEGLIFVRLLMGMQSPELLAGTGVTQPQWDTARSQINTHCAQSFAP